MGRYRHELIDAEAGVYRYDHLIVLHAVHMPTVLLEAGSIINRQEERARDPEAPVDGGELSPQRSEFCASREQAVTGQLPSKPASVPITKVRRGIRPAPISHPSTFVLPKLSRQRYRERLLGGKLPAQIFVF